MTIEAADVVISGAGPNGLLLACELALAGVRPVVLDKLPGPSDEPKANGLVGQVIRQLDMRGLYHVFGGDEGAPRPAYGWMFAGIGLDFLGIDDNPMYALLIQQPQGGPPAGEAGARSRCRHPVGSRADRAEAGRSGRRADGGDH